MNFLPLTVDDEYVYVGLWKRFCARVVDAFVLAPILIAFYFLPMVDKGLAIFIEIVLSVLAFMYPVYCHAKYGATIGKFALKIRVTKPDGTKINWKEAWLRSAVDMIFTLISLYVIILMLMMIDRERYIEIQNTIERSQFIVSYYPDWYPTLGNFQNVWLWLNVIVLFFNKRKRAIHDFIAGTVVVYKEFCDYEFDYIVPQDHHKTQGIFRTKD